LALKKLTNLTTFLASNQQLLTQIKTELNELGADGQSIYSSAMPIIGGASIGAHLRHILDFYTAFYFGAKNGRIDYDIRQRNSETENKLNCGIVQLSTTIEQLEGMLHSTNREVEVNSAVEIDSSSDFGPSNLLRELQTLHSHTTHHMAIIAIALKLNNVFIDDDFGKAPSTILYEHSLKLKYQPVNPEIV
jgi:uncharacterized damage-inducible protein DinB